MDSDPANFIAICALDTNQPKEAGKPMRNKDDLQCQEEENVQQVH